jgi:hypothetical protein
MLEKNKVYPYVVVLKQKNRRSVELAGLILGVVAILLQLQKMIGQSSDRIFLSIMLIVLVAVLIYNIYLFQKRRTLELFSLLILGSAALGMTLFGLAFFIMALLVTSAIRPVQIGFSENEIMFDTLFKKRVQWSELNNAMIKDGILTLDYKNNKLLQKETDDDDSNDDYDVSEEEFNAFCRDQLLRAHQQPAHTS